MLIGKNITLRLIEQSDLELIRLWRNSPEIYEYMSNRNFIYDVNQNNWYDRIIKNNDIYMMIQLNGISIGMIHLSSINLINRTAEWGIFIFNKKDRIFKNSIESAFLLLNYGFSYLNLNKIFGTILPDNLNAIYFNKLIGFTNDAVLKQHIYYNGHYHDLLYLSMFQSDWNFEIKNKIKQLLYN